MKRSLGKMSKRSRLRARVGHRRLGIPSIVKSFQQGERVAIDPKSGHFGNMPHPRYRGRHGVIIGRRGSAYVVEVRDYGALKKLIIPALHLERVRA